MDSHDSRQAAQAIVNSAMMVHEEFSNTEFIRRRQIIFSTMGGQLYKDGNQWCAIVGEMPEHYIVGFADTAEKALSEWYKNWQSEKA